MLRLLVSPKWIAWHVLTLGAMVACGFLSAWQWHRAGSAMGSALNVGYGVQWPIFAVFFGFMWWRFLRMEIRALGGPRAEPVPPPLRPGGSAAPPENGSLTEGLSGAAASVPSARTPGDADNTDDTVDRPSPFGPRPAGVGPSRLSDPQIRAYNEALADLAARDRET